MPQDLPRRTAVPSAEQQTFQLAGHAFEEFLAQHGFAVLLVRRNLTLPCVCEPGSARTSCPYCLGSGFVVSIERHRAVERTAAIALALPRGLDLVEPGPLSIDSRYFYLPPAAFPKTKDLLAIPHRLDGAGRPVPPLTWYEINHTDPRMLFGQLLYWWAASSQEPVAGIARSVTLVRSRSGELRYLPVHPIRPVGHS